MTAKMTTNCVCGILLVVCFATSTFSFSLWSTNKRHNGRGLIIYNDMNVKSQRQQLRVFRYSARDNLDSMIESIGGEKYEMVQLPDSMMDTTLFVGNLCEFVTDDDLSNLFSQSSSLIHVPACVARKPNNDSLKYGFVTFPSKTEKESAIIRFSGIQLNGKRLRVEEIVDKPRIGRVRVPGKFVAYAVGEVKWNRDGNVNAMRKASDPRREIIKTRKKNRGGKSDIRVEKYNSKMARKYRNKNSSKYSQTGTGRRMHLNDSDLQAYHRAAKHGFVTLESTGFRRGRKSSPLASSHRQRCHDKNIPQIVFCKASGGRPLDNVIVDLSTMQESSPAGRIDHDTNGTEVVSHQDYDLQHQYMADILMVAESSGMTLKPEYQEDNMEDITTSNTENVESDSADKMILDIADIPCVSVGVFEGERSSAKKMVKQLANLWDTKDLEYIPNDSNVNANSGSRSSFKNKPHQYGKKKHSGKGMRDHKKGRQSKRDFW